MGLLIKPTKENKILLSGTKTELDSIYARITFAGHADGKTLECSVVTYSSKDAFKSGLSPLSTSVFKDKASASFKHVLKEKEKQTGDQALELSKKAITELGYEVDKD